MLLVGLHRHVDGAAGAETDGVRHQISADLVEAKAIPPSDDGGRRRHPHLTPGDGSSASNDREDVANRLDQVDVVELEIDSPAGEPRDIKQAVEGLQQPMQTLFDSSQLCTRPVRGDRLAGLLHLLGLVDRQPHLKHQRRNRIPQLMGDRGDELVSRRYRPLQFLDSAANATRYATRFSVVRR